MIMPLHIADLYLWYGSLGMECLGEFALLSPIGHDPLSGTCKFWTPSGRDPNNKVAFTVIFEWGNPINGATDFAGL